MSLTKQAAQKVLRKEASKEGNGEVPHPSIDLDQASSRIANQFDSYMKSAGLPLKKSETDSSKGQKEVEKEAEETPYELKFLGQERTEKTASTEVEEMRSRFLDKAAQSVMAEVSGKIYQDPLLSRIADTGDLQQVAKLAEGRYADADTLKKWAEMDPKEVQRLAAENLKAKMGGNHV